MINNAEKTVCLVCFSLGVIAPWGLLAFSAALSVFSDSEYWRSTAAYLAAAGIIWLGVSYLFTNLVNRVHDQK